MTGQTLRIGSARLFSLLSRPYPSGCFKISIDIERAIELGALAHTALREGIAQPAAELVLQVPLPTTLHTPIDIKVATC